MCIFQKRPAPLESEELYNLFGYLCGPKLAQPLIFEIVINWVQGPPLRATALAAHLIGWINLLQFPSKAPLAAVSDTFHLRNQTTASAKSSACQEAVAALETTAMLNASDFGFGADEELSL